MDDKDRTGENHGAVDALRPKRPGGAPKAAGETDQRPDPANAIPRQRNPGESPADPPGGDERPSGMIDDPVGTGDGFGSNDDQAGARTEFAPQRGGPTDNARDRATRR